MNGDKRAVARIRSFSIRSLKLGPGASLRPRNLGTAGTAVAAQIVCSRSVAGNLGRDLRSASDPTCPERGDYIQKLYVKNYNSCVNFCVIDEPSHLE